MSTATTSSNASLEARLRTHPVITAVGLVALVAVITVAGSAILANRFPSIPGYSTTEVSQSLVLVIVLAVLLLALIGTLRWWRLAAFTPPSQWRDLGLYWLPVLLLLAPLAAGVRLPTTGVGVGILLVGYLATAVLEEGMYRGVILGLLWRVGMWPAVLLSSLLFGIGHLSNSALRGVSALILLQAFGAAVQGVGFAALRLRTNTIWPLIVIHAAHDITLQLGQLPIAAIEAPIDTIICVYGLFLLRRHRADAMVHAMQPEGEQERPKH